MPLSLEEKVRLLSMVDVFEALSEEELRRGRDKDRHPLHPRATRHHDRLQQGSGNQGTEGVAG